MKIKFIKDYISIDTEEPSATIYSPGNTLAVSDDDEVVPEAARWLINNGFAEEVKESGWWKPKLGEEYSIIKMNGKIRTTIWVGDSNDEFVYSLGLCFKTKDAAERHRDYLKAIATVRQDEGVIDLQRAFDRRESVSSDDFSIYTIAYSFYPRQLVVVGSFDCMSANAIWFDTIDHADASLDKHHNEWKIIANYDWSRE